MKKLFLLFAFLLGLGVNIQAEEETPSSGYLKKEVTLTEANTLATALGDEVAKVTELVVKGPLGAEDFVIIRQMESLQKIDIQNVDLWRNILPDNAFNNMTSLQQVLIPQTIAVIGSSAFNGCNHLEKVDLSLFKDLKEIKSSAFCNSTMIQSILKLPSSLYIIGEYAFSGTGVTSVDFSNTEVHTIGDYAFKDCPIIGKIKFKRDGISLGDRAFSSAKFSEIDFCLFDVYIMNNADPFPSVDKETCIVKVPYNSVESYKSNNYWSNFGDNIMGSYIFIGILGMHSEFHVLCEEGEEVTAETSENSWWGNVTGGNFGFEFFVGWYNGDQKLSDNPIYTFKALKEYNDLWISAKYVTVELNVEQGYNIASNFDLSWIKKVASDSKGITFEVAQEPFFKQDVPFFEIFDGWYENDKKFSSENQITVTHNGLNKKITASLNQIRFKALGITMDYIKKRSCNANSVVVYLDKTGLKGQEKFIGWYEGENCLSKEYSIEIKANGKDREIEARVVNSNIDGNVITDTDKIDGADVSVSSFVTIEGEKTWNVNSFNYELGASLLVNSDIKAKTIFVNDKTNKGNWMFLSLPYTIGLQNITTDNVNTQFVVRKYDGSERATNGAGNSWKQLQPTDELQANTGYIMQTNNGGQLAFNAPTGMNALFNRSAVEIPLTTYASSSEMDANWNFIGNPYPCYYSVSQLYADGLDGMVTVWSQDLQNYEYYSADDANAYIDPLTAFFIQKKTSNAVFKPEGRVAALPSNQGTRSALRADDGRTIINLVMKHDSLSDRARVVFNEAASVTYELGKDAAKFYSPNPKVPMLYNLDKGNQPLAIDERPYGNGVVRLGYKAGVKGTYTIQLADAIDTNLTLVDLETGATIDLSEGDYTFETEAGTFNDRLELRSAEPTSNAEVENSFNCYVAEGQVIVSGLAAQSTLSVMNALGQVVYTSTATEGRNTITLPSRGVYYVSMVQANGQQQVRSIKW